LIGAGIKDFGASPLSRVNKSSICVFAIGVAWIIFVPIRLLVPLAWQEAQKAAKTTAITQGEVVAYDGKFHSTGTYDYWVNGAKYESSDSGMSDFPVGSSVPVYYDPQNPLVSFAIQPPPSFIHNLFGIAFIVLVCLAGVLYGAFGRRSSRSRSARIGPPPLTH
jgi:hypothetical protein